MIYTSCHSSY